MSGEIKFNNSSYYFKSPNLASIYFIGFRGPWNIYKEIKNSNISIEKAEEDEKKFQSNLSEIISGNPKYRKKYQSDAIKNIRNLYNSRQKSIYLMIMLKLDLTPCIKQNSEHDLKY